MRHCIISRHWKTSRHCKLVTCAEMASPPPIIYICIYPANPTTFKVTTSPRWRSSVSAEMSCRTSRALHSLTPHSIRPSPKPCTRTLSTRKWPRRIDCANMGSTESATSSSYGLLRSTWVNQWRRRTLLLCMLAVELQCVRSRTGSRLIPREYCMFLSR
jgi:hypothetical protein